MYASAIVVATLAAIASAAPGAVKPSECQDVPVVEVKNVTAFANSNICSPLPLGVCGSGVMVANVTYELPCAFGCPGTTTIWCEGNAIVDESKNTCTSKYWFCCGDNCRGIPAPRTCEYQGKEYTVGVANDLGNGVTMWCVDEETAVTCTGQECGSTLELTPPRVETCPVPPPKPEPECRRDSDCPCPYIADAVCGCKHGKCVVEIVPPKPEPECRRDRDCPCPYTADAVCECKHGKCVVEIVPPKPEPECRRDSECPCPYTADAVCECKHGKCVVEIVPPKPEPECRRDSDCPCPKIAGAVCECKRGECVVEVRKPEPECSCNEDCEGFNDLAVVCEEGKCVPAQEPRV